MTKYQRALLPPLLLLLLIATAASAFRPAPARNRSSSLSSSSSVTNSAAPRAQPLYDPVARDAHYGTNTAQYLLDLHETKATFDFCGGMLFQLVLTDALKDHLVQVASTTTSSSKSHQQQQPVIFDASQARMAKIPRYEQSAQADNVATFHGREIRQVPDAAGGMGMVLQLSLASDTDNISDPQGWTPQEMQRYDGWGHDSGREWRKAPQLQEEGFVSFSNQFGTSAYSLHHRFYLHLDRSNRMWLSAEDGCEGTPVDASSKKQAGLSNLFGLL